MKDLKNRIITWLNAPFPVLLSELAGAVGILILIFVLVVIAYVFQ